MPIVVQTSGSPVCLKFFIGSSSYTAIASRAGPGPDQGQDWGWEGQEAGESLHSLHSLSGAPVPVSLHAHALSLWGESVL